MDLIIPLIVAILAGFAGGGLKALIDARSTRRKTSAETHQIEAETEGTRLDNFIKRLDRDVARQEKRIEQLEADKKLQDEAIENLNGKFLKLGLAYTIVVNQLYKLGEKPRVLLEDLDTISIDELKRLAQV